MPHLLQMTNILTQDGRYHEDKFRLTCCDSYTTFVKPKIDSKNKFFGDVMKMHPVQLNHFSTARKSKFSVIY